MRPVVQKVAGLGAPQMVALGDDLVLESLDEVGGEVLRFYVEVRAAVLAVALVIFTLAVMSAPRGGAPAFVPKRFSSTVAGFAIVVIPTITLSSWRRAVALVRVRANGYDAFLGLAAAAGEGHAAHHEFMHFSGPDWAQL